MPPSKNPPVGWQILKPWAGNKFFFYPTTTASPYEALNPESEMIWGQMQTLSGLISNNEPIAVVTTEQALQPHLPPADVFQ